jgi:hypothetical protein
MGEVYEQVVLTCTTINLFIIIGCLTSWIVTKVQDHREKKRKEKDSQDKQ